MSKKSFILNMLKNYGEYNEKDIDEDNDKKTIDTLRKKQKKYGILTNLYSKEKNEKRGEKIYSTFKDYIDIKIENFLDFGGGSCDIAYYIGKKVKAKKVYCVDIEDWMGINWNRCEDVMKKVIFMNNTEKIPDKSINCILVSHTLHHIQDDEIKKILEEFDRILTDNGMLIIQEHDSPNENFNKKLDMQHMIYDTVLTQTTTYNKFIKQFYSNYKSISEWGIFLNKFYIVKIFKLKKYDNSFIGIYKKTSNYFININGIDKSKIKVSNIGKYSVSHSDDAIKTANIILSYFDKNITITDATANNGGNTIPFALTFKNVNSVEINKNEFDILINNINVYNLKNIKTFNNDYLKIINKLKQDVVFIDPPWGGKNYKKRKNIKLFLGNKTLFQVIDMLKDKCKAIVCKVPFNYNFFSLFKYGKYSKKIHLYIFQKYVIFVLLNRTKENSNLKNYQKINLI